MLAAEAAAPVVADAPAVVEPSVIGTGEPAPTEAAATLPSEGVAAEAGTTEPASLVEGADATKAETPAEPIPEPVVEAKPEEPVAPEPITYEAFKLPEGLTIPEERLTQFTSLAGENRLTQEQAQKYLDLHADVVKATQEAMDQRQRDTFDETRAGWRKEVTSRFGNRADTVVNDAKWAVEQLFPNAEERSRMWGVLSFTGAGDNPDMIDFMARAARRMRERTAPPQGVPMRTTPTNPADRRYGTPRP